MLNKKYVGYAFLSIPAATLLGILLLIFTVDPIFFYFIIGTIVFFGCSIYGTYLIEESKKKDK